MRKSIVFLPVIIMGITCVSNVFAGGEKTVVTIWHTFTESQEEALVKAADDFNAGSDRFRVEVITQAYAGFTDTVKTAVQNGVGPDIIIHYATEAANYVENGQLVDLSQFIYADDGFAEAFDSSLPSEVMECPLHPRAFMCSNTTAAY